MIWRNDDPANDSDIEQLKKVRDVFEKHGLYETYSVVPFGKAEVLKDEKYVIAELNFKEIEDIVGREPIHGPIVDFLKESVERGHLISLHGHTHTKISSEMTRDEIYRRLKEGKELLEKTLNTKIYFYVAPFNDFSQDTVDVCDELGLILLDASGDILEDRLKDDKEMYGPFCWYHYWSIDTDLLDKYLGDHYGNE
jgi:peptidoglycan/xylan/chitin deacetylase (PgdA/CDA1 family)